MSPDKEFLIYVAGLIDSGSSFFFIRNEDYLTPCIRVRRSGKIVIDRMQKRFGGTVGKTDMGFEIRYIGQACTTFLVQIIPWLQTKLPHAQLIMDYNYHIAERRKTLGIKPLTDEERMYRQGSRLKLQAMKNND